MRASWVLPPGTPEEAATAGDLVVFAVPLRANGPEADFPGPGRQVTASMLEEELAAAQRYADMD